MTRVYYVNQTVHFIILAFGFTSIMNKISVPTSHRTNNVSIKDTNQLLLFPGILDDLFSEYNQQDAMFFKFIYFCKTLYMFQTVFPSIITSSKLHLQRQAFVRLLLLPAVSLARLAAGSSNGLTNA